MNMKKPRILFVTEAHYLATGYGTYTYELLSRLHKTGKYEIIELASYGKNGDPRIKDVPWKFIGNNPDTPEEDKAYNANPINQLGLFKFDKTCLSTFPDIVADFRDEWYFSYQTTSVLRPNYRLVYQPTVDSEPQNENWLYTFQKADRLLTYTHWAKNVLSKSGLSVFDVAPLGADLNTFKPIHKKEEIRKFYGLNPDINLIGFVSRNQPRKLFPDLFLDFNKFLENTTPDLARKTFLFLHTSYPDNGWDLSQLLKKHGLGNKVLFSYICHNCGHVSIRHWQDGITFCHRCNENKVKFPSHHTAVPRPNMVDFYNMLDLYVQYANSEGIGIGQLEAAACGVPVATVNYSGMVDVINCLGGYKIDYLKLICEPQTMCLRAVPNPDSFINILNKFFNLNSELREKKSDQTRAAALQYCDWDKNAKIWEKVFDSLEISPIETRWGRPPRIHTPASQVPANLNPQQFVKFALTEILGQPELQNTYAEMKLVYDIANELMNPQDLITQLRGVVENNNMIERIRYENFQKGLR